MDNHFRDGAETLDEVEVRRNGHTHADGVGDDTLLVGGSRVDAGDDARQNFAGEGIHAHCGPVADLHGKHVYLVDYAVHLHVAGIDNLDYISCCG